MPADDEPEDAGSFDEDPPHAARTIVAAAESANSARVLIGSSCT
jgi:hypothetical protein